MSYNSSYYLLVFLANSEPQPWSCFFCKKKVWLNGRGNKSRRLNVHHKNGNHDDDRKSNLVAAHQGCHTSHHNRKNRKSPAAPQRPKGMTSKEWHKQRVQEAMARPEVRAKMRAPNRPSGFKGRTQTPETRAQISASLRARHAAVVQRQDPTLPPSR